MSVKHVVCKPIRLLQVEYSSSTYQSDLALGREGCRYNERIVVREQYYESSDSGDWSESDVSAFQAGYRTGDKDMYALYEYATNKLVCNRDGVTKLFDTSEDAYNWGMSECENSADDEDNFNDMFTIFEIPQVSAQVQEQSRSAVAKPSSFGAILKTTIKAGEEKPVTKWVV